MSTPNLNPEIASICEQMESFEAPKSLANTGTGSRLEGSEFESLVQQMWNAFSELCCANGAKREERLGARFRKKLVWHRRIFHELTVGERQLIVPYKDELDERARMTGEPDQSWLETEYTVHSLVENFPGKDKVIRDYAPSKGRFAEKAYPSMYDGMSTGFDDTVLLVKAGALHEKILLEYKTAKSSNRRQVDGNAHERLSFQIMQYLEVATRYTQCSLMILANGAFVRYKNKYHVNFHIQAERLKKFPWFTMEYACTQPEYQKFLSGLLLWLFNDKPRSGVAAVD
ncbi:hypothetical protein J8C06_14705 [Chloracidobacterium validum]|uniref:YqaJ viral recombinase domain-containing protein n=1 Tax=Chloracidobacterium validum TaxID=2821543 RepID=A0ABX8BBH7_9BACT|nr:hypothetical protein [Chloracidobacterium validum]QUW04286.1 hypothetical protein J8C06_14705 [Chloracidobacterium validum]